MTGPLEPSDPGSGQEDTPPGGGRRRFPWILGLIAVAGVLAVVSILVGGTEGAPPPGR